MKSYLARALWTCIILTPAALDAQTALTPRPQSQPAQAREAPAGLAPSSSNQAGRPAMIEGHPIETRPPEKADDHPAFREQTRAPYHASTSFKVTTLIDNLPAPWSVAFLPDGKILLTERLPGSIRILDSKGVLSEPVAGVAELASPAAKDIGVLDVVLDPLFATNHQILFTFYDFIDGTNSNTYVARGQLDEAKCALTNAKVIFRTQ